MPPFKDGTYINRVNGHKCERIRISAGPQRGKYVDVLVLEAKLGRPLEHGMTVEHSNGNTLDCDPDNLEEVTLSDNQYLKYTRRNFR